MACYFDGVNVSFFSHGFSATPHQQATGSECFHLFIWFVSSCDYLLPQHQYLEKVSAKNCSSLSPKENTAKPAFNESLVSVFTLSSWIPVVVTNFIRIFGFHMSTNILLLNSFIYLSNSFINPIVYTLRIPEFKEALRLCCAVRREIKDSEGNAGIRVNLADDHNHVQPTFEQENVDDTKL